MLSLVIRIFAGHLFKTIGGEIKAGWHWLFASATHLLEAGLALALVWGFIEHRSAAKWQQQARHCIAGRKADAAANLRVLQDIADKTQAAAAKVRATAAAVAEENAHAYQYRADADRAAAARYLADPAHRVRSIAAARGGDPASPGNRDPGLPAAPPADADMVAITARDFDACTDDHAYAFGAFDLIQALLAKGLVVPEVKLGGAGK